MWPALGLKQGLLTVRQMHLDLTTVHTLKMLEFDVVQVKRVFKINADQLLFIIKQCALREHSGSLVELFQQRGGWNSATTMYGGQSAMTFGAQLMQ